MTLQPTTNRLLLALVALSLLLASCGPAVHGPWLNERGEIISNAYVLEYRGLGYCDQTEIVFFQFFGRQFAKDPQGLLGELVSVDGARVLTFEQGTTVPETAVPSAVTHQNREVYLNEPDEEDYLYIVINNQIVERWPRAEHRCTIDG